MNRDDIIAMAREAGIDWHRHWNDDESNRLERFAALVASAEREARSMRWDELIAKAVEAEREACAKVCEEDAFVEQWKGLAEAVKRIRARGAGMSEEDDTLFYRSELESAMKAAVAERDHARAHYESAVRLLNGIHALLYPPSIKTPDGRTMVFRPKDPDPHQVLQALSDRIRALPDELAAIQARGQA